MTTRIFKIGKRCGYARALFCCLVLICFWTRIGSAATADDSPLPRDPANVCGQFDNGLKYIIRNDPEPPGKVVLYLEVQSGALNETDQQNGLAHFLEHMAFKGSTHSKPEQLIPFLMHMGMMFGADTNAHTNLWETCFKLTMPDAKPETIDTALTIFSDYANGLLLSPVQIESERRVILEELRARKNVAQRLNKQATQLLYADTRLQTHDILGDENQIKTFPRSEFVKYWDTWYRPENMTLVVAGDIDPQAVVTQAKAKLASFTARAPKQEPLKAGLKPFSAPRAFVVTDPEQVAGEVEMYYLAPARPPLTTFGQLRRDVKEEVCQWIVNRRFSRLVSRGSAPFRQARIYGYDWVHEGYLFTCASEGQPQDWKAMLAASIGEIKRGLDHGFTQQELDLCRKELLADAEWSVKTESSVDAKTRVTEMAAAVGLQQPILSASQYLALLHEVLDPLKPEDLQPIFTEDFGTQNYSYVLKMPSSGISLPAGGDVLSAAGSDWLQKTAPPEIETTNQSLLASQPVAGEVASREADADVHVTTVTFANGVVLHHKFTDYRKDQVIVQITLPGGTLEETAQNRGISAAASIIFAHPATTRFTSLQIEDLLTGKNVSFAGSINRDAMQIAVSGSPTDLPVGLELTHAVLTDPVLEPAALDDWKKREHQAIASRPKRGEAKLGEALDSALFGGDIRMMPLNDEMVDRQSAATAQAWFKRIADHAAMEVAIVGDLPEDQAVALVAKYLGSLPKRTNGFDALDHLRVTNRGPGPYSADVTWQSASPKSIVQVGYVSCDQRDPIKRRLALASVILTNQMIQRIRFKDQLVYSIFCTNSPGLIIPGTGLLSASAPTDPKNADRLADTIAEMIKAFAASGPSEEDLTTAKKQIANQFVSQMPEPGYWISLLGDMTYRGRTIAEIKELPQIYQTFTAEQVRDAVRKYATEDRFVRIEANPAAATAAGNAPGNGGQD